MKYYKIKKEEIRLGKKPLYGYHIEGKKNILEDTDTATGDIYFHHIKYVELLSNPISDDIILIYSSHLNKTYGMLPHHFLQNFIPYTINTNKIWCNLNE